MRTNLIPQKKTYDLKLLATVLILVIFGLLMIYDASVVQAFRDFNDSYYYIRAQLIWVVIGFLSLFFFSRFDYKKFKPLALILLITSLILLIAASIQGFGVSGGGAHRWLNIGPITLQPSEIVKLTGVIYLATIFEKKVRFSPFAALLSAVVFIAAVLQKDLGSAIVFFVICITLYFAAGAPLWHFLISILVSVISFLFLIFTSSYRSKRVMAFLDPFSDPQGYTYHISQILIALGSGGLFGLGLGQSRQKFEYIPEVTTDSIFAIIGEELGFMGALILIGVFVFLIYRGLKISNECRDNFGRILSLGLIIWLGIQIVINISSNISLIPLTGVPLPFISYGGSALVANLTAVGILLNISKNS